MSEKLAHFIHVAPGNTTQDYLQKHRTSPWGAEEVLETEGGEDTWAGRMDGIQLNMAHSCKHILTNLEKSNQVQDMKKVRYTHTHIRNKCTYDYQRHLHKCTQAFVYVDNTDEAIKKGMTDGLMQAFCTHM